MIAKMSYSRISSHTLLSFNGLVIFKNTIVNDVMETTFKGYYRQKMELPAWSITSEESGRGQQESKVRDIAQYRVNLGFPLSPESAPAWL